MMYRSCKRYLFYILLLVSSSRIIQAQEKNLSHFYQGLKEYTLSPASWDREDWITVGGVVGISAFISLFDEKINNTSLLQKRTKTKENLGDLGRNWGTIYPSLFFLSALAIDSYLRDENTKSKDSAYVLASSLIMVNAVTFLGKRTIGRHRPDPPGYGSHHFKPFTLDADYFSTPSSHLSYAATLSWAMAARFESWAAKSVFYTMGVLGAFSRMYTHNHWASDVVLTSLLSFYSVQFFNKRYNRSHRQKEGEASNTTLLLRPNGLTLIYSW